VPEVEQWVDRFHARLATDPTAMRFLTDEATVIRFKRSLTAWFLELFSPPFDARYARAREEIGRVHARIGLPQYLMVTAMNGVRRDVDASVDAIWGDDPPAAARVRDVLGKVLDLELALMLDAYRRRSLEVSQQAERALFAGQIARWVSDATRDVATAVRCYAELFRRASSRESRDHWGVRLRESLDAITRLSQPYRSDVTAPSVVPLSGILERALANVSLPARTVVERVVDPPGASGSVCEDALRMAVQEMIQGAANRDPGGKVRLGVRKRARSIVFEVVDTGPGWPEGVRVVADAYGLPGGMGLALCQQVAVLHGGDVELFSAPGGGAGLRLTLDEPSPESARADPHPVRA
jgi:signal transduction histidine kinase